MKNLGQLDIGHQLEEGREIEPFRHGIDRDGFLVRRDLHDTKARPESRFPQKFGIDGDEIVGGKAAADGGQLFCRGD